MERTDRITAEYVPPPPREGGHIWVKAPLDKNGRPVFSDLHLTIAQAIELDDAICMALSDEEDSHA